MDKIPVTANCNKGLNPIPNIVGIDEVYDHRSRLRLISSREIATISAGIIIKR